MIASCPLATVQAPEFERVGVVLTGDPEQSADEKYCTKNGFGAVSEKVKRRLCVDDAPRS